MHFLVYVLTSSIYYSPNSNGDPNPNSNPNPNDEGEQNTELQAILWRRAAGRGELWRRYVAEKREAELLQMERDIASLDGLIYKWNIMYLSLHCL